MTRDDTIRQIAAITRTNHRATLWAVGWLALDLPTEELKSLLIGLEEFNRADWGQPRSHLEAFVERFGREPGR